MIHNDQFLLSHA